MPGMHASSGPRDESDVQGIRSARPYMPRGLTFAVVGTSAPAVIRMIPWVKRRGVRGIGMVLGVVKQLYF